MMMVKRFALAAALAASLTIAGSAFAKEQGILFVKFSSFTSAEYVRDKLVEYLSDGWEFVETSTDDNGDILYHFVRNK